MKRLFALFSFFVLFGAGCTAPWTAMETPPEPLCLAWGNEEGFRTWTEAYLQKDGRAVALAQTIRLPKIADHKLVADLQASLEDGDEKMPTFLCTLDDRGQRVAWVMESLNKETNTCTDTFYVSIDGRGTTSDFVTQPSANCAQLCKPKRLEEGLLVWQCDLREATDGAATWSQLHMNRDTGATEVLGCQEDALGMPSGCVR